MENRFSKFILGTVQFGLDYGVNNSFGRPHEAEVAKILECAFLNDIRTLDTAANYGESEKILGRYFQSNTNCRFDVITKLGLRNNTCEESLKRSLANLGLSSIDTLLFHSYKDFYENRDQLKELDRKHKGSHYKRVGVSVYTNEEIEALLEIDAVEVVQAPFNLLDNQSKRGEAFIKAKEAGKEVHVRSVFLQGLFFKPVQQLPESLRELSGPISRLLEIADETGLSMRELALLYSLSKNYIDRVLFGVDSLSQLEENISACKASIPDEAIRLLDQMTVLNDDLINPSKWVLGK